jgi:hypothetical protein
MTRKISNVSLEQNMIIEQKEEEKKLDAPVLILLLH